MFLIIQTGDPVSSARVQFGSFAQWFTKGLGLTSDQVHIVDVHLGQALPKNMNNKEQIDGIIITGSAAMVTDKAPWMLSTQRWLQQSFKDEIPTLGVCFGHQLLADMLGGSVTYNPKGRHMGISQCELNSDAKNDQLFKQLAHNNQLNDHKFPTFVSHLQAVTSLPQSATLLGSTAMDNNHVFHAEKVLWGVQFHPEWSPEIMAAYIHARQSVLMDEGFNPDAMTNALKPCDDAYELLSHFTQLALAKEPDYISAL